MSIKHRLLSLRQSGDTIVEVLIVLAVLGLAIGISYSTATKSLLATRQAQENTQATQLLQGQIERLYALSANASTVPDNQNIFKVRPAAFCITSANLVEADITQSACRPGFPVAYQISILYCVGNPSLACSGHATDDTFVLTASWDNVQGQGTDNVTLTYRVHPS